MRGNRVQRYHGTLLTFYTGRVWYKFYSITEIESGTCRAETFNYNKLHRVNTDINN